MFGKKKTGNSNRLVINSSSSFDIYIDDMWIIGGGTDSVITYDLFGLIRRIVIKDTIIETIRVIGCYEVSIYFKNKKFSINIGYGGISFEDLLKCIYKLLEPFVEQCVDKHADLCKLLNVKYERVINTKEDKIDFMLKYGVTNET